MISTRKPFQDFISAHKNYVLALIFANDGIHFLSGSSDHSIKLWSVRETSHVHIFEEDSHRDLVKSLVIAKSDEFFCSCSRDRSIKMWDFKERKLRFTIIDAHDKDIQKICLNYDDTLLISGSADSLYKIWDLKSKECIQKIESVNPNWYSPIAWSIDGQDLYFAMNSGKINCWNFKEKKSNHILDKGNSKDVISLALTTDKEKLLCGSADWHLRIFDTNQRKVIWTSEKIGEAFVSLKISADEQYFVASAGDGTARIWLLETFECIALFHKSHSGYCYEISISKDNTYLVSGGQDRSVKIWDLNGILYKRGESPTKSSQTIDSQASLKVYEEAEMQNLSSEESSGKETSEESKISEENLKIEDEIGSQPLNMIQNEELLHIRNREVIQALEEKNLQLSTALNEKTDLEKNLEQREYENKKLNAELEEIKARNSALEEKLSNSDKFKAEVENTLGSTLSNIASEIENFQNRDESNVLNSLTDGTINTSNAQDELIRILSAQINSLTDERDFWKQKAAENEEKKQREIEYWKKKIKRVF